MKSDPFFIVGSGRCGTNLLRDMLRKHPQIKIPPETHFFFTLHDKFGTEKISSKDYLGTIEDHYSSDGSQLIELIAKTEYDSYPEFKSRFLSACSEAGIDRARVPIYTEKLYEVLYGSTDYYFGDKTPHYGVEMNTIREFWPDAKFIHLIRDGVHVADSMTRHPGFIKLINGDISIDQLDRCTYEAEVVDLPSSQIDIEDALDLWERLVKKTRSNGRKLPEDSYIEMKYESVLLNPDPNISKIGDFLGVETYQNWRRRATAVPRPFYLNNIRNRFTDIEYNRLFENVQPTMEGFGYPDKRTYNRRREMLRSVRHYWLTFLHPSHIISIKNRLIR